MKIFPLFIRVREDNFVDFKSYQETSRKQKLAWISNLKSQS